MFKFISNNRFVYNVSVLLLFMLHAYHSGGIRMDLTVLNQSLFLNINYVQAHIASEADVPLIQQTNN
jgi:hypothetical protein